MAKTIICEVVSAEGEIFSGEVEMVIAPGVMGDLGIAPNHAPLLTYLNAGPVRLFENNEEGVFYISGGILEVQPKRVTILADVAPRAHDIDESAAQLARDSAKEALLEQRSEMTYPAASSHLAEAKAQLRTVDAMRKNMGRSNASSD